MAIITQRLTSADPGFLAYNPARSFTRLVKQDIVREPLPGSTAQHHVGTTGWTETVRKRTSRHDPKTPAQIACRAPMRFARTQYFEINQDNRDQWNAVHPTDFFCEAVKRWLAGHSPAVSPYYPLDDESELTVTASCVAAGKAMLLTFAPSHWYALWGIAVIRDRYEIVTPTWPMLRLIYPTRKITERTWLDTPLDAGVYHYRFAACEITGRLGPFSADIFDTIL